MNLSDLAPAALAALARKAQTSADYLRHLAKGRRRASIDMAVTIEKASGGTIGRETLVQACQDCKYRKQCTRR